MLHKHLVDGLQVVFGGEVHHRQIFIVELFVLLNQVSVALNQVHEQILVRIHMAVEVHRHEAGQLKETGIYEAAMPAVRPGHRGDDRPPEPVRAFFLREFVDRGWALPRIDRASLQDDAPRKEGMVARFHKAPRPTSPEPLAGRQP